MIEISKNNPYNTIIFIPSSDLKVNALDAANNRNAKIKTHKITIEIQNPY